MNSLEMKTYTMQEVSKIINVPVKTIKRWEKNYSEVMLIPRTKQGSRVYSEMEISMLKKVKELSDKNTSRVKIVEILKKQTKKTPELLFEYVVDYKNEPLNYKNEPIDYKNEPITETFKSPESQTTIFWDKVFKESIEEDYEEISQEASQKELEDAPEEMYEEPLEEIDEITQEQIYEDLYEEAQKEILEEFETSLIEISSSPELTNQRQTANLEDFFQLMDAYKQNLLEEVKSEIRNGIRNEVIEEVKKEISKSSLDTVKSLSKSISRLKKNTKSDLEELSEQLSETSENSSDMIKNLSNSIEMTSHNTFKTFEILSTNLAESTEMTTEEIAALSNRISETTKTSSKEMQTIIQNLSNEISKAQEGTKIEISNLTDSLNKDREMYIEAIQEERLHFAKEIRTREAVFQNLVENFRNTASAREAADGKRWWKFWK